MIKRTISSRQALFVNIVGIGGALHAYEISQPLPPQLTHLQQAINTTARNLHTKELEREKIQKSLLNFQTEEKKMMTSLRFNHQKILSALHHLRHINEYSPTLAALSSPKADTLIHATMLLRCILPQLTHKHKDVMDKLRALLQNRKNRQAYEHQLKTLQLSYHTLFMQLNAMMAQKQAFQKTFGLSAPTAQPLIVIPENKRAKIIQLMIGKILSHHHTEGIHHGESLKLSPPAIGRNIPCAKGGTGCFSAKTLRIQTTHDALVTAPIDGTVMFTGVVDGHGCMVLIHSYDYFVAITGIDALFVTKGQVIKTYDPLGRTAPSLQEKCLKIQLWQGEKEISPLPYLLSKENSLKGERHDG